MINREIVYERNVSRSYMKIPAGIDASFDEKMMLKKHLSGLLPVEKCYVNGAGQYWYNISGKQALDTYCKMKTIGVAFIEKIILSICNELEILEWNLIDVNCMVLDPELIFIGNGSEEIVFTIYPGSKHEVFSELQHLMEYLLTKVDHKDKDAVHAAYGIYEMTLNESYSIMDIKDAILEARGKSKEESVTEEYHYSEFEQIEHKKREASSKYIKKDTMMQETLEVPKKRWEKLKEWYENILQLFHKTPQELMHKKEKPKKEEMPIVYPTQNEIEKMPIHQPEIHPTVCLSQPGKGARGFLRYEGLENYPDFQIQGGACTIGKEESVELVLNKETISRIHAKIERLEGTYYIEDLNSTNGTFVNEEPLIYKKRTKLKENDIIRFADIRYRFF